MKPFLIDTHTHLDDETIEPDLDVVIKHALDEGVWMVTVGSDLASSRRAVEIASRYEHGVYAAVGLHPHKAPPGKLSSDGTSLAEFRELAAHPKVVAIGEIGLDYSHFPDVHRNDPQRAEIMERKVKQKALLSAFLEISRERRLPALLHCRNAHDDMLEILENWDKITPGFNSRGIVHCFSGTWKQARRYFNLGFLVSVTGVMCHGAYNLEVIKNAPANHLVIESDCPHAIYKAQWAARRNEPSYLPTCLASVAGLRKEEVNVLAGHMVENTLKMLTEIRKDIVE
jgi:TatD DNase family protein